MDTFAAFLHVLPTILGAAICLLALYGFWRGLSMRPHKPEHRAPSRSLFWWDRDARW